MLDCAFGTGGSMIKMEKIRANKMFFNEQLESAEDYDYWVKGCPFLSFAVIDEVLYKYRVHHLQNSIVSEEIQKQMHLLIVQKHLLKFNIKINVDTLKTTLSIYKKKFPQALKLLKNLSFFLCLLIKLPIIKQAKCRNRLVKKYPNIKLVLISRSDREY